MTVIDVVGAAIRKDDRFLVAQRSATMSEPLCWEFPGGKVEEGETDEVALAREIREELDVMIEVKSLVGVGSVVRRDRTIVLRVYEAALIEGAPVAREHAQLRWFSRDEFGALDWAEADVPIVERLRRER
ncbi:MAG: (deoxy)nucleoside triphosphate pyrophosphohydrolase [Deltaproteobacteria bacterium]|nr:(deoxy)nucleoside triphosphate pyrophosphohydrolase [Deltaproteobacteria bacterium]